MPDGTTITWYRRQLVGYGLHYEYKVQDWDDVGIVPIKRRTQPTGITRDTLVFHRPMQGVTVHREAFIVKESSDEK